MRIFLRKPTSQRLLARLAACALCLGVLSLLAAPAAAYNNNGYWESTATQLSTGPVGTSVVLTWSIVPDGTTIPFEGTSNLIAAFDSMFGTSGGADLESRTWFTYLQQSFDRWEALSGIDFVYEPADDGVSMGGLAGDLDTRGDIRIAGTNIDGGGGTFAQTGFIPAADITIDTADIAHWTNAANSHRNFRNTLEHEIGHSFGLGHLQSSNAAFLMETPFSSTFDGPQLDDIRGAHYLYGDVNERSNGGAGNNTLDHATDLELISSGNSVVKGTHAATGTLVLSAETEFVSVSNSDDFDYFSFSVSGPSVVDIVLNPLGSTYNQRILVTDPFTSINTSAISDLTLQLYALVEGEPDLLSEANATTFNQAESILDFLLPTAGEYFIRASGAQDDVQLYQLSVGVEAFVVELPGDYNENDIVDAADYSVWRDALSAGSTALPNDPTPGVVDGTDFEYWRNHFGDVLGGGAGGASVAAIPEPATLGLLFSSLLAFLALRRPRS